MKFLLIVLLSLISFSTFGQTSLEELLAQSQTAKVESCECDKELTFRTVKWSVSSRGNEFCTRLTKTGKTVKEYKKYFTVERPAKIIGYTWKQVKKGRNFGKWYKVKE